MAPALRRAVSALLLAGSTPAAWSACVFDNNGEITNPFAPGCGDVMFTYTENNDFGGNIALGYPPPIPVASLTPVDGFREYASLFARHQALLAQHDEVTGQAVGQTLASRDIWAYEVSDTNATTPEGFAEAAVMVNGGIHAREWQSPEAVTGLLETLVAMKADAGLGQFLVENLNTVIVPVQNVDGFLQTQSLPVNTTADRDQPRDGRMRRKNLRNPVTQGFIDSNLGTVADNFWGIDLNRNLSQGFGQANGSSSSLTSLIYRGETAESEPETLALLNAATLAPAARLRLYSDTHSFLQAYLATTTGNARRDAITGVVGRRMAAASDRDYVYAPDAAGSVGIGTTADEFGFAHQITSWTLELEPANGGQDYGGLATHTHSGFILPDDEVARMRDDVATQYLIGFYHQAGPPAAIAAEIRDTQTNAVVYAAQWQRTSATARTLAVTANEALVPGRDYRLWVAFNKPMRIRNGAGTVVAYPGQNTGASVGTVTFEVPSLAASTDVALAAGATWLNTPGGAPNGYLRYEDDAFAVNFNLPASLNVAASTSAVVTLAVQDMAQMLVDANPATAVDWGNGSWQRLENVTGALGDTGGTDCQFRPFVAPAAGAQPPATTVNCRAATPPPPPPPPPPNNGGGGGGEGLGLLALALALLGLMRLDRGARLGRAPLVDSSALPGSAGPRRPVA